MGKIADDHSDEIYLTDDNPRYENPNKIRRDIKHQVNKAENARKAGVVPILKGGREGKGLDETKAKTKTSFPTLVALCIVPNVSSSKSPAEFAVVG